MEWRDQRRADHAALAAQQLAARVAMREQDRRDTAEADSRQRARRTAARNRRKAFWSGITGWVARHTMDLLFVPVIVIPAVLAWPAMAAYGMEIFPFGGVLLPGFTEGSMWAFAFAVTLARRAGKPVAWLLVGLWASCVAGAGVNFLHGYTGHEGSFTRGVVMALVSVGGVVVHQMTTARPPGPRPTRDERDAARVQRLAQRRVTAVRATAVRRAVADLAPDGTTRLVVEPGLVRLSRSWSGRARLVPVIVPQMTRRGSVSGDPAAESLITQIERYLASGPSPEARNTSGTASTPPHSPEATAGGDVPNRVARRVPALVAKVRDAIESGVLPGEPTRTDIQRFLRVRAQTAIAVTRALYGNGEGNSPVGAVT